MSLFKNSFRIMLTLVFTTMVLASSVAAQNVRLRSQIAPACTSSQGSGAKFADIFAEGNIAVMGSYGCKGVFIFDISNPDAPILASWYNPAPNQQFLEAVIIGNRGYFGAGSNTTSGGGVHIVDLTNPYSPVLLGRVTSTQGGGHNVIHEMVVFNQNGNTFLIENYNGFSSKILKIINVTNPSAPVLVHNLNPTEPIWVHAMVVKGNRLYTSGWGSSSVRGRTEIYDISNIAAQPPTLLGFISDQTTITAGNSMHSAWPSEDGNWLYSCRENSSGTADLRVYDISNVAVPLLVKKITMEELSLNAVSPHNPVVMGNKLYIAWYQAGTQIFDLTNPANPVKIGAYDTYLPAYAPPENKGADLAEEPWDMVCGAAGRQNGLPTSYDGNWAVFPFLGEDKVLLGDLATGLYVVSVSNANLVSDFDGDKRTDMSVFSPSTGDWRIEASSNNAITEPNFGLEGDILTSGDYDGDDKTELSIFRPSTGSWWFRLPNGAFSTFQFGLTGDVPVPGDYDADGKTDVAVWRPSNGLWFILQSTLGLKITQWGLDGDKPMSGDFDGDGKTDIAVWRPSNGVWYVQQSLTSTQVYMNFGLDGDKPLSGDFDGNGKTDFTIFRPSTGVWYILDPAVGPFRAFNFGLASDIPIPADYDGDGKADIAVFRPEGTTWYLINSSSGSIQIRNFGKPGDVPSPGSAQPQ